MTLAALQVLAASLLAAPNPSRPAGEAVSIVAGGDVMLDRGVRARIQKRGARALFSGIAPLLRRADFAFANLECPLAQAAPKIPKPNRAPSFKADPTLAPALKGAGFDVLSIANNHALDCGPSGLAETLDALGKARLHGVGAGRTSTQAMQPIVTRARGVRIAWVAATEFASLNPRRAGPAVAGLRTNSLRAQVRAARGGADVVVLSLHWGIEYQGAPTQRQREWARVAFQAGADVILGHHPHVLGPAEEVRLGGRRRLVAYSLGNLVFDPPRWNRRAQQSALLQIEVGKSGVRRWNLVPLQIREYRPSP